MINPLLIFTAFIFLCISCDSDGKEEKSSKEKIEQEEPVVIEAETTEYQYKKMILPEGFNFDTIYFNDSTRCAEFMAQLVLFEDSSEFSDKFREFVQDRFQIEFNHELMYVDSCNEDFYHPRYTDVFGVESYLINDKIYSVTYVEDSYGEGGNHHNYGYFTLNYDLKNQKEIKLEDLMDTSKSDVLEKMTRLVNENQKHENCESYSFNGFIHNWNFSIRKEGIEFSTYSSWACSLNSSFISYETLIKENILEPAFIKAFLKPSNHLE